jgi:predicted XRE-type DNA-binding protein
MKKEHLNPKSLEALANDWGVDYQVFRIKSELIDKIRSYCAENGISQRNLASRVEGLTQDRVSKIFSGQVGHMTIDKLIEILTQLGFKVAVKAKAA